MTKKQKNTSLLILLFVLIIWYSRKNKSKTKETQTQYPDNRYGWNCSTISTTQNNNVSGIHHKQCNQCIFDPITKELTPNPTIENYINEQYNNGEIDGYFISTECKPLYECEEQCDIAHQSHNTMHWSGVGVYDLPF